MRDRHRAVLARAALQQLELLSGDFERLPGGLQLRVRLAEQRMLPKIVTPAAVGDAEQALEEHRRLVARARRVLRRAHEREQRRRLRWKIRAWWLLPIGLALEPFGCAMLSSGQADEGSDTNPPRARASVASPRSTARPDPFVIPY